MRMYVYSMVSGTVIQNWNIELAKRDDVLQMLDNFWETGSDEDAILTKRWGISHARAWIGSNSHKAKAVAMGSLISIVSGCSTHVIALGRRAICGSADGKQACLSWNGGDHTMKCSIAAQIIKDARSGLGEFGDISAHCAKAFYDDHGHASGACVSNRADSCHG